MSSSTATAERTAGDALMVECQFDLAAAAYSRALDCAPTRIARIPLLARRAAAYLELDGRAQDAHRDAMEALQEATSHSLSDVDMALVNLRLGQALLKLARHAEAQAALLLVVHEPHHSVARRLLESHNLALNVRTKNEDALVQDGKHCGEVTADVPKPIAAVPRKIREAFYQNEGKVTWTLFVKDVPEESVKIDFKCDSIDVQFKWPGNETELQQQRCVHLFALIDPKSSSWSLNKFKLCLILQKVDVTFEWKKLEREADELKDSMDETARRPNIGVGASVPHGYPSSSKAARDWNRVEREVQESEAAEKPEGDAALNALFQQIYRDADPDTRRAMVKSFQTSGGTVLSTNWSEVKEKDYEREIEAPQGMEARRWNT